MLNFFTWKKRQTFISTLTILTLCVVVRNPSRPITALHKYTHKQSHSSPFNTHNLLSQKHLLISSSIFLTLLSEKAHLFYCFFLDHQRSGISYLSCSIDWKLFEISIFLNFDSTSHPGSLYLTFYFYVEAIVPLWQPFKCITESYNCT